MKRTETQKEFPLRERILLFFFAVLSIVCINGVFVHAAEKVIYDTADFSVKAVEETADSCKIVVTPKVSMEWIIIHFGDQNVSMEQVGNDFSYQVTTASHGDTVDAFFTYKPKDNGAQDSGHFSYTVGSAFDEAGSGDNNGNDGDDGNTGDNDNNNDDGNNNPSSNPRIEAEDYISMSGVTKDNGQITNLDVNDWMRYSLNIPTAGTYRIVVRGKSENKDGILVFRDANKRIGTVKLTGNGECAEYKSEDTIQLPNADLKLTVIVVSGKISADWIEFEPVDSGNGDNPGGDKDPDYVDPGVETTPIEDTTIPEKKDKMVFQFNNVTNGAYRDDQIYWCALGYKPGSMELCYINAEGDMIPVNPDMNTLEVGDRKVANIFNTLSQNKYVYMPSVVSGRMYISYGSPVYITINQTPDGVIGFAGPDMNNPSDPNQDVNFEFMEFTIGLYGGAVDEPTHYWGNTTRVDNFCFPVVSRLIGENRQYDGAGNVINATSYDKTVGDVGGRDTIRREFVENAPEEFKEGLVDDYRIFAPCKRTFNEGQKNANFYQQTIDEFWEKYSAQDLVVNCEGGNFVGRTKGDELQFTTTIDGQTVTGKIDKPTTQDVLEGKGAFDRRSLVFDSADSIEYKIGSKELVLEAQLCAAFNRGLALKDPSTWSQVEEYYKYYPYNYYSKFWHEHSIDNKGYGFCYDDVYDQSTLLECNTAKKLVIDLKWN